MKRKASNLLKMMTAFALLFTLSSVSVSASNDIIVEGITILDESVTEDTSEWLNMLRGTYLNNGTVSIGNAGSGKVKLDGSVKANGTVDKLTLTIYLYRSVNGSWTNYDTYTFSATNTSILQASKTVSVTKGYSYYAKGVYSVTKGSVVETGNSSTSGLKIS